MEGMIINIMNQFGYIGVFLLITIENIFPPIPSELILTFGGFMTLSTKMKVPGVIFASTLGSLAGALILYILGSILDAARLERLTGSRLGKMLHLNKEDIKKSESWFLHYGSKAIFFGRFVPIVRSLISIPAGMSRMKLGKFLFLTTLGTLVWNTVLIYSGRIAGEAWAKVLKYFDLYTAIAGVVLAFTTVILCIVFVKKKLSQRNMN